MTLKWTEPVQKQLDKIYRFYEQINAELAVEIYNDIVDEADRLIDFPLIAAIEPVLADFTETYRSLMVRKIFKVVYRVSSDVVYIVAVFDCRQDPHKLKNLIIKKGRGL